MQVAHPNFFGRRLEQDVASSSTLACGQRRRRSHRHRTSIASWTCVSTVSASSAQRWTGARYSRRFQLRNRRSFRSKRIRTADGCSTGASTCQGVAETVPDHFGWAAASSWTPASACDPSLPSVRTFERTRGRMPTVRSVSVWNPPWSQLDPTGVLDTGCGLLRPGPAAKDRKRGRNTTLQTHSIDRRGQWTAER